jgi:bifunctional non-homologous end joining protein LigD
MLSDLLEENGIELPIIYSEHLIGDGQEMFEHAAKLNFEGIVSKNAQAPHRSDRNEGWLKIKTVQKGEFPVIGFVKDPTGVAALYLGKREGKDLIYTGKMSAPGGLARFRANSKTTRWRSEPEAKADETG